MLSRFRRQIVALAADLGHLKDHPDDLAALLALQLKLIGHIRRSERQIARLRTHLKQAKADLRLGRQPKHITADLRKRARMLEYRIDDYQYLKFIWKCFGDGIAFIYLDKFALKHVYFDTTSSLPKQDAGALDGKAGLRRELTILKSILKKIKVPAMLCDISNTIRHGDICSLVGPDPEVIEVKSSGNRNSRTDRQMASLEKLTEFFEKDEAKDFRGLPRVGRTAFQTPEVTHLIALSRCIAEANANGTSSVSPEPGLHYVCIREGELSDLVLPLTRSGQSRLVMLNELKRSWPPYFPFVLSIGDPDHLYQFLSGDYVLMVIVDFDVIVSKFDSLGFDARVIDRADYVLALRRREDGLVAAISPPMVFRLFVEFVSLDWFVKVQTEMPPRVHEERAPATDHVTGHDWLNGAFEEAIAPAGKG